MDETPSDKTPGKTPLDALDSHQLREVIRRYGDALRIRRKRLDDLNVYPVPDGDTGTNMALTVQSVIAELDGADEGDMTSVSSAISKGAVMGARGNSGAILAQVLRGIAESAKEKLALHPNDVADALERARKSAYESVLKPVEGTILTVVTAAATSAREQASRGAKLEEQLAHIRQASAEALARTPELLPILKQAGVVDAGGSGFLLFVDALRYVATGEPIPGLEDEDGEDHDTADRQPLVDRIEHTELSDLRYEVMFLLDGDDAGIPALREAWGHVGDSIVVVGGDRLFNCHIHTDDIGAAIEIALDFGRPRQIRITDLLEQTGEHTADHSDHLGHLDHAAVESSEVTTAIVAVVNGDGLTKIYRSLGAQQLVVGGQSMNPSVAELLSAVEAAPAQQVVVLPNNSNVVAAARQLDGLTSKTVRVLPTKSVVEGMLGLLGYDSTTDVEGNVTSMSDTVANVVCGEITQAVRDTTHDDKTIDTGDWLGLVQGRISVVSTDLVDALCALVEQMTTEDNEMLTLIEGADAASEATDALRSWVASNRPRLEVEVHQGGQPLYPYLIGVE